MIVLPQKILPVLPGNPLEKNRVLMYNTGAMKKSDVVFHLKGRWRNIAEKEKEALSRASCEERLIQTAALMDFARHCTRREEGDPGVDGVRKTWKKLKARLG